MGQKQKCSPPRRRPRSFGCGRWSTSTTSSAPSSIVVGINGGYELMHYESGLFLETGEGESGVRNDFERVDHAVMVVGWAKNPTGKGRHWIIKNSYGANWGEHGYFKMGLGGDTHGIT